MQIKNAPALTVREENLPAAPSSSSGFLGLHPKEMVKQAAEIATLLAHIIKTQKLSVKIGPNEYVKHDGWATLGTLLGILPREKLVVEHPDGSFEAYVELYSVATGQIVGQGSAICGKDETRWKNAERFARRSMAVTRATGKAYRLGFGWIMALSGYQSTPAEEMPLEAELVDVIKKKEVEPVKVQPVKAPPVLVYTKADPDYLAWVDRGLEHCCATAFKDRVLEIMEGKPQSKDLDGDLLAAIEKAKALEG